MAASSKSLSPVEFMNGPREKIMYVSCLQPVSVHGKKGKCDYLATVDVDPESPTYCKVINRLYMPEPGDELHHFAWNACISCPDREKSHKYLILPGFYSGNLHIIDVTSDPLKPKMIKFIKGKEIKDKFDLTYPHTVHCIPSGEVMIHTLGDKDGNAKGGFFLLDGQTFEPKGLWNHEPPKEKIMGHDFWYQPRHNIMISSELGAPNKFSKGFDPADMAKGFYGTKLHFWHWNERELFNSIDLGEDGAIPMEIRFLHNPDATDAYIVCAVGASVFHISLSKKGNWEAKRVIKIPHKIVKDWQLPFIPALITDCLISLDDKYLFITCYLHGDVRMYDISKPDEPKLVSQVFVGGSTLTDTVVKVTKDEELVKQPERQHVKGRALHGGPHMVQLSRDGKRLYVSLSIMTPWDKQFYPKLAEKGGVMILLDVSPTGMKLSQEFLIDFGTEPDGAVRAHEMRYPGGDCTSDIWV
ncbi:Selenium-binding protein 1 [Hypsibius exemplaris]|uniref:Selenium-binding protein 1 n=1 Tax=Hypsibius exemplaris TaxID=2072580 RepID=A0A9X6NJL1_HYPEX|nr:Selenium-binding protein 1 [Hypsibius exemplaris]